MTREQEILTQLDDSDTMPTIQEQVDAILDTLPESICFCFAVDANGSPLNMHCPMHNGDLQ